MSGHEPHPRKLHEREELHPEVQVGLVAPRRPQQPCGVSGHQCRREHQGHGPALRPSGVGLGTLRRGSLRLHGSLPVNEGPRLELPLPRGSPQVEFLPPEGRRAMGRRHGRHLLLEGLDEPVALQQVVVPVKLQQVPCEETLSSRTTGSAGRTVCEGVGPPVLGDYPRSRQVDAETPCVVPLPPCPPGGSSSSSTTPSQWTL